MAITPKSPPPTEKNNEYTGIIYFLFALLTIWISIGVLGFLSTWLYSPITLMPYKLGLFLFNSSNSVFLSSLGVALGLLPWAGLLFVLDLIRSKKYAKSSVNPERSHGLKFGVAFILLYALSGVVFSWTPLNHPLFSHIHQICNPKDINAVYTTCQSNFMGVLRSSKVSLALDTLGVNILFVIPILPEICAGFVRVMSHPDHLRKKALKPEELIDILSDEYKHLKFFKKFNPNVHKFYGGGFKPLLQSREFAVENNLISGFTLRKEKNDVLRMPATKQSASSDKAAGEQPIQNDYIPIVDAQKFELVCLKQLGSPWEGIEKLSAGELVTLAIAAPQCCATEKSMMADESNQILREVTNKLNQMWDWLAENTIEVTHENERVLVPPPFESFPQLEAFKEYLAVYLEHPVMKDIISRHAYVNTIIYATFIGAKTVSVLQPSSFRWLKLYPEYRSLYALVQNVGRPSVFSENMASVAHYYHEVKSNTRIYKPHFQSAYSGFCERLSIFLYTKDDKEALENGKLNFTITFRKASWYDEYTRSQHAKNST